MRVKDENNYEKVVEATVLKSAGKGNMQNYIFENCHNLIDTEKLKKDIEKRLNQLFPPKCLEENTKCFKGADVYVCYSKLLKLYANGPLAALLCTIYAANDLGIDVVVYVYSDQLKCYYPILN